jgi:hypothetical protein
MLRPAGYAGQADPRLRPLDAARGYGKVAEYSEGETVHLRPLVGPSALVGQT